MQCSHRLSRVDERRDNLDGVFDGDVETGSRRDKAQEDREEGGHKGEQYNRPCGHQNYIRRITASDTDGQGHNEERDVPPHWDLLVLEHGLIVRIVDIGLVREQLPNATERYQGVRRDKALME